ncbi:MAG: ribonuclease H-like domain-containing protein, partial [Bacteroidetes bacterium]|nr:ribonuclease H-like domain-containing protein [Bacteroidota bacterium]
WEIPHLDTMELWKFGDYKSYTSLDLLASIFGIPTPKDDIDGSEIHRVYWEEKDLARIVTYCQKDVITVAKVLYKFIGKPFISEEEIVIT